MKRSRGGSLRLGALAAALFVLSVIATLALPSAAVNTRTFTLDSPGDLAAGVLDRVTVTSDGQVRIGPEIQRIAPDPAAQSIWCILDMGDGSALAGSGVDGRVYRVEGAHATLYAETGAVVVTSLARAEDGTVYAATLPEGRVFKLNPPQGGRTRAPDVFVSLPGVQHVWAIAWDRQRHALIAATGPDGKLFAIDARGHASVVFDSDEPNLYSLAIGQDGTIYTGAGGGHAILYEVHGPGQTRALARLPGDEVRAIVVSGDVVYAASNEFPEQPEPAHRTSNTISRVPSPGGPTTAHPHPGHGSLYRITRDGVAERIYRNADAHVNALEYDAAGQQVYVALAVGGRVVAVSPDRTSRVIIDVDESQVLALAITTRARLFGTADAGALYLVTSERPASATWTSRVLDANTVSQWGAVRWRGNGALDWEARSGNAEPPDSTWSAWQSLTADGTVQSPRARYLQVRARWSRDPSSVIRAVTIYYLPTNQRAVLTEVTAEAKTGEGHPQQVKIGWKVDNPDNDSLRFRLRFRVDDQTTWRPVLRQGEYVTSTSYDWPVDGLPEGYYRVQVEASDEASNPESEVLRDTRASEPLLVDNTPPQVSVSVVGDRIRGEARDAASAVTRVEFSIDTQDWHQMRALDGVLDERTEQFEAPLPAFSDNDEHVIAVRAYDEAGNLGSASAIVHGAGAPPNATPTGLPRQVANPRRPSGP